MKQAVVEAALAGECPDTLWLALFGYQAANNTVYAEWLRHLRITPGNIEHPDQIPCLPISAFRHHRVRSGTGWVAQSVYRSSGTTGQRTALHEVEDTGLYLSLATHHFEQQYGSLTDYVVLALLPSYLERGEESSLVAMIHHFIQRSNHPESGFYLDDTSTLARTLQRVMEAGRRKVLLFGVTFALLDFANNFPMRLNPAQVVVMETGGMKGRRRELTRAEVHEQLCHCWGLTAIHSEYGMTELLSQAYAPAAGLFRPAPLLRIQARQATDPLARAEHHSTGVLNVFDAANIHSCAFIATDDLVRTYPDGTFEILGRLDNSDIRGCNLLVQG